MAVGDVDNPDRVTEYGYDALGRLETVTERAAGGPINGSEHRYQYDLLGNLAGELAPNNVFTDYLYDALNRLDKMTSYRTDGTNGDIADLTDNEVVAQFDYTVRDDGRRTELTETIYRDTDNDGTDEAYVSSRTYDYDHLGRLVDETLAHWDDSLDFHATYAFDATGNRVKKSLDQDADGTFDEITRYYYNAGDQLLEEIVRDAADSLLGTTEYDYTGTQRTGKTVSDATSTVTSTQTFLYDLQGRMEVAETTTYSGGVPSEVSRSTYDYDAMGMRISALREIDTNADGTFESKTKVEFLVDHANPTGYEQVVRETHTDVSTGNVTKTIDYTFGHDEISQTVTENGTSTTSTFLHDGHGDVRMLLDAIGAIETLLGVEQIYFYDAYGDLLNMTAAEAATTLLHSGEQHDLLTGLHLPPPPLHRSANRNLQPIRSLLRQTPRSRSHCTNTHSSMAIPFKASIQRGCSPSVECLVRWASVEICEPMEKPVMRQLA